MSRTASRGGDATTRQVLTKPKILTVPTSWLREYQEGGRARYVLSASDYQRLVDAVRR